MSQKNESVYNSTANAQKYRHSALNDTYYLAYRDIPELLKKHAKGNRAIDYGCGTGRSTKFLKDLGYETLGVDINKPMLEQALKVDPLTHYLLIENAKIPVLDNSCDVIFSCLVLCTIPSQQQLIDSLKEAHRCLKKDGVMIVTTASDIFYTNKWVSYNTDYPENKSLKSGDQARFYLKDLELELTNYYWKDVDYRKFAKAASLEIIETVLPLGNANDHTQWISEALHSPYMIYVIKNKKPN